MERGGGVASMFPKPFPSMGELIKGDSTAGVQHCVSGSGCLNRSSSRRFNKSHIDLKLAINSPANERVNRAFPLAELRRSKCVSSVTKKSCKFSF